MNIYVYSDESGVFDKVHNNIFVFGGLIILGSNSKEKWSRRYSAIEKNIRKSSDYNIDCELKATKISNHDKNKIFRSLNNCYKFGVVIDQQRIHTNIFDTKKDKQRYLDYAYKIAVKRALEKMICNKIIEKSDVDRMFFYVDEHTTATNGCYELEQALEQEFKSGTFNFNYCVHYPPLFPGLKELHLELCNSQSKLLVRAADIVANKIYYIARNNIILNADEANLNVIKLPQDVSYF